MSFQYPMKIQHSIGARYVSAPGGGLRCIDPGRVTYSSDWPTTALVEIARLRKGLEAIADGVCDPQAVAKDALGRP